MLRSYPGDLPVFLLIPNGGSDLKRLNLPFLINPQPALTEEVKKLLGSDAFKII